MAMSRAIALLVVLLGLLVGCGDEPGEGADPEGTAPAEETSTSRVGDPRVLRIISGSAADGEVAEAATVIEEQADLTRYLRQFSSPAFVADLQDVVDTAPLAEGRLVALAVIAIGCDAPPSATVEEVDGRFLVTPGKIVAPHMECFAPVTSVAVLDVPDL